VLAIPVTAIDIDSDADSGTSRARQNRGHVVVVGPDNRIQRREVVIGLETANRAEVLTGLNNGDMVVIGSRSGLQDGQLVTPKITSLIARDQDPR
jgi:hypothetical protein